MKPSGILKLYFIVLLTFSFFDLTSASSVRKTEDFCKNWKFNLGDIPNGQEYNLDDSKWRILDLPHDWSIEGEFSKDNPADVGGGALPGGIGWYRKYFQIKNEDKNKLFFIEFDGIYRNSEVWINGHYLGKRPYGYISFRYELTPYLKFGEVNLLAVKVDNSQQPNSRWYSGSGIYRNVRLVTTEKICIDHWGTFVTTPEVTNQSASVNIKTKTRNLYQSDKKFILNSSILDKDGKEVSSVESEILNNSTNITQELKVSNPILWTLENPYLYKVISTIKSDGQVYDNYETVFGIRTFSFDREKGFFLNGKPVKINGVCNHHDLGCLGTAVNVRALERQIEIMKKMGVNSIRTSHNPPAPELLDLCDKMGIIVMDEAFDVWNMKKTEFDYSHDWDEWYRKDIEDFILRDRNHPSVIMWSIGNEILEQWDSTGIEIAKELVSIVKSLDTTRIITSGFNGPTPSNFIIKSDAIDLIGFNYHHKDFSDFQKNFPGKMFIATETISALATRGYYDMPSDSVRIWPIRWDIPLETGNPDNTCSSYDNCHVPWGSTHEETWKILKNSEFMSGQFIWTGFDYLGEPTPYVWPSRSSYFGIVDLAGFPKDAYYMYQSEWTNKPVLHVFPHWNWKTGDTVDVWVYTNFSEVELFLNDESLGAKKKAGDDLHLSWRVVYKPGTLKAVGYSEKKQHSGNGSEENLIKFVKTAGIPAKILLEADRNTIESSGKDLSFVTVKVLDKDGTLVPYADNLINFEVSGEGKIAGVDNGLQTSHEPFNAKFRKAFNGLCLAVIQSTEKEGEIILKAESEGLEGSSIIIQTR